MRVPRRRPWVALVCLLAAPAAGLAAQGRTPDLRESQRRLEEIRRERERLQAERERLQGQVHDLNRELALIERQRQTTNRIVNEIEAQIGGLNSQMDQVSATLALAQDNLAEKRAVLSRRLVDIYKRGPLYAFQVLLAAESFGDLLSRYKYLFLTGQQDRALVSEVERLRDLVLRQRREILDVRAELDRRRVEREAELRRYGALLEERARRLRETKRLDRRAASRLTALERDEARLNEVLAAAERSRRAGAGERALRGDVERGSLSTADIGKLDWPVEGRIVKTFGRQTLPSGAVIRWNGIGIAAEVGTPVKVIESGKVLLVTTLGTYGLSVIVSHGAGYYSMYGQLERATVVPGQEVAKGQVIGHVGGANSDEGPHLHFEIRGENQIALDPIEWLRKRR
ncbi:MAG TPA: peptidoglycan DD-metalloendopeptidase family protein [Gemmatimonadales bacterium]|nr:peptidoglycan DD-metalloendopeptidase family protein [Gemmatimonadales bacterium]